MTAKSRQWIALNRSEACHPKQHQRNANNEVARITLRAIQALVQIAHHQQPRDLNMATMLYWAPLARS